MTPRLPFLIALALLATCFQPSTAEAKLDPTDEYILLVGGPSLLQWENFRREEHRHDRWWGNFVRANDCLRLKRYYERRAMEECISDPGPT